MRVSLATVLAALAIAGCGGDDAGSGASAAEVVPADAIGYVEVDADLDSDQWRQVQELLDRFPAQPKLIEQLNDQLGEHGVEYERDVAPALGPTVAIVFPNAADEDAVLLTQPDDLGKWRDLVATAASEANDEYVLGEVDGWQAAAESRPALDALRTGGASLAENADFQAGLEELPQDRLAFGWAGAEALRTRARQVSVDWIAGAVEARDDGAAATIVTRSSAAPSADAYASERVDQAPAGALAFISFNGESLRAQASNLAPLARMFGLPIDELVEQVRGEAALWVHAGAGLPEITLVTDVADGDRAGAALRRLLRDAPLDLKIGLVDGELVATTASSPEAALGGGGDSLAESEDFREAVEAAGMPDETNGFVFVNVADAVPLLGLASLGGPELWLPQSVLENLRPIRSAVAWAESVSGAETYRVFVQIQ